MTKQTSYQNGLLFTRAHQAVRGRIYGILEKYEMTPSLWAVLGTAFNAPDGIRLSSVAQQMDVKAPLVTMLSNELIEKNLIKRIPHHTDGRAKLLVATAQGKKLSAAIEQELNQEIARLMRGVSSTEASVFRKTLETILENSDKTAL